MTDTRPIKQIRPGPEALKALTHADRLRMLAILRLEGPQTASGLATRLGLTSGATSYHLRQLAQHGFIEDAPDLGTGRDRWWRAAHESTNTEDDAPAGSSEAETIGAYLSAIVGGQVRLILAAQSRHAGLPVEWRRASTASDATFWLTADEARALTERLVDELRALKAANPPLDGPAPQGSRRFSVQIHAFPHPGFGETE
ncbi:ArsR/SmtB family transcription factor [Wenxinia marina]|uniref:Transcriptional regulator, ArsR family n=1 Tax=Wenxinia marina DSM 24838 TaxID=1123501 RepID=A0A0D0NHI1_9RHOB|nr:helix-turn-helix domain-containing protein [Wenxinia marina]KIQ67785.1 transcriptional regulator, ArsR family [Wenxinia marina DSM 24838]GGL77246.1 transcriptional regulator [Wenxinia marina]